jgi:steroid Delta-isomerase
VDAGDAVTEQLSRDLVVAVEEHTALFNACVDSGDWGPFLATFTDDARMTLTNVPVGPFEGRARIADFYASRPPTQPMILLDVRVVDDGTVRVRLAWASGRHSTMVVHWRGAKVAAIELTA